MNLSIDFKEGLGGSMKILIVLGSLVVFLGGVYYIFFMSRVETAPTETALVADSAQETSYQKYAEYVQDARMADKTLLELEQFKKLSVYEFGGSSVQYSSTPNPFGKFF